MVDQHSVVRWGGGGAWWLWWWWGWGISPYRSTLLLNGHTPDRRTTTARQQVCDDFYTCFLHVVRDTVQIVTSPGYSGLGDGTWRTHEAHWMTLAREGPYMTTSNPTASNHIQVVGRGRRRDQTVALPRPLPFVMTSLLWRPADRRLNTAHSKTLHCRPTRGSYQGKWPERREEYAVIDGSLREALRAANQIQVPCGDRRWMTSTGRRTLPAFAWTPVYRKNPYH